MKQLLPLFFCFSFLSILLAHPGTGLVCDSKGNVYFTDLNQVWQVSPDGAKSIYVPRVHTHELYLDKEDNLYGEDAWYEGEATDKWGFAVWKKAEDSKLEFVIDSTEGFLFEHPFGFVRDEQGSMYWREKKGQDYVFKKQILKGNIATLATGTFENIRWQYWLNGHLYFIDLDDLYRIENGAIQLIVKNLRSEVLPFSRFVREMHSIMGLWNDKVGNIYVAVFSGKVIKKISLDGTVSDYLKSEGNWSPSGGVFDQEDNLWLLEYSSNNKARVRKFTAEELDMFPGKLQNKRGFGLWPMVALILLLSGGLLFLKRKSAAKNRKFYRES